jgi:hypothetical protein
MDEMQAHTHPGVIMNALVPNRPVSSRRRNALSFAVLAALALGFAGSAPSFAQGAKPVSTHVATPIEQAAQELQATYREEQFRRLSRNKDRDSLIAAVLLVMPGDDNRAPIDGLADAERHLASDFGRDSIALFTMALACQMQDKPCVDAQHYDELVRIAPDNAVHWLLLPHGAAPSDAQLHAAATAKQSDTHLRDIFRIVRAALAYQPAPALRTGVDPHELALELRRDALNQVMLPKFGEVLKMCKGVAGQRRDDCIAIGRLLEADRSGSILSRMVGSAMLRRLFKGTPEEVAAKELRGEYVWMGEQLESNPRPNWELLQNETVTFGEWEALKRFTKRTGATPLPPAGWIPKNPQTLLLSEERTPAPTK